MIMADVLAWFLIILGIYVVLNGYWLCSVALFPRLVQRCQDRYSQRPVVVTVVGLVVAGPLLLMGAGAARAIPVPFLKAMAAGFVLTLLLIALIGSAGLAQRVGAGLKSPGDETRPWRRVLRGGAVLSLTFVLPLLGWFLILPWVLVSGFGAFLLSVGSALMERSSSRSPSDDEEVAVTSGPEAASAS